MKKEYLKAELQPVDWKEALKTLVIIAVLVGAAIAIAFMVY